MYVGFEAKNLIERLRTDHAVVVRFMDKIKESYLQCGRYIQKKLPLENDVLKSIGMLDPMIVSSFGQKGLRYLLKLLLLVTTVLSERKKIHTIKRLERFAWTVIFMVLLVTMLKLNVWFGGSLLVQDTQLCSKLCDLCSPSFMVLLLNPLSVRWMT